MFYIYIIRNLFMSVQEIQSINIFLKNSYINSINQRTAEVNAVGIVWV